MHGQTSPATHHAVNTVLAAVKVEQNVTHHLDELYSCSCFVSDDGRAVYTAQLDDERQLWRCARIVSCGYGWIAGERSLESGRFMMDCGRTR